MSNSVEISPIGNGLELQLFDVYSEYFLMTQFLPFSHDKEVTYED